MLAEIIPKMAELEMSPVDLQEVKHSRLEDRLSGLESRIGVAGDDRPALQLVPVEES